MVTDLTLDYDRPPRDRARIVDTSSAHFNECTTPLLPAASHRSQRLGNERVTGVQRQEAVRPRHSGRIGTIAAADMVVAALPCRRPQHIRHRKISSSIPLPAPSSTAQLGPPR